MQNDSDDSTGMRRTIVQIAYRSLSKPIPYDGSEARYVYYWPFRNPPVPGQWVVVPTSRQPAAYAVITGLGDAGYADGAPINTITSLVPEEVVAEAQRKARADTMAWLWVAQRAAGFPAPGYPAPPDEYPYSPIPPANGPAPSADIASEYGHVWRRVHRRAEEYRLPDEQVKRFNSIAQRWFALAESRASAATPYSEPSSINSETRPTAAAPTDVPDPPGSTVARKWLLVLAAIVIVLAVIAILVWLMRQETDSSVEPWPTSSHSTPSQTFSGCHHDGNGVCVTRPAQPGSAPSGAFARCRDGTYSFSRHRGGTCAAHGGVATWLDGRP